MISEFEFQDRFEDGHQPPTATQGLKQIIISNSRTGSQFPVVQEISAVEKDD